MRTNLFIPTKLKPYFNKELKMAEQLYQKGQNQKGWHHLERAHILGQKYAIAHTLVHWKMLRVALKAKDWQEARGQTTRLIFGGIMSIMRTVPTGNSGGSNISALQALPIEEELQKILDTNT